MWRGWPLIAFVAALPARAQDGPPPRPAPAPLAAAPSPLAPATAPTPEEVVLEFRNLAARMTVPVTIGGETGRTGPWNFIVDTGAERTVVSRELAATLGLVAGNPARVVAMSGVHTVPTVLVPDLAVSSIAARGIVSPALAARDLGALGMVGIDALQQHSVVIDFDRQRMLLKPSSPRRRRPAPSHDDVVVTARSVYGQLIVTDAHWRGRRIAVVVDTGTPVSVGNTALRRLMTNARPGGAVSFTSATGGLLDAEMVTVQGIEVGGVGFTSVAMAIADAAPFRRFGLSDTPALLMGMDLLRLFRVVRIDFANREIRFTLPRGALVDGARVDGV